MNNIKIAIPVGSTNLGPSFWNKLVNICNSVGMHPEDVLAIMVSESGIQNNQINPNGKGGGIFGAMPETQRGLGFKGSPEEFVALSGEQQLDYFQKFLRGAVQNAGGPIKSAEQYYVANFLPIAMHLPGIKANDMNTVFIEKNPEVIDKGGRKYSKKYWDIGIPYLASNEISAYNDNPLFHGVVPNAISLGSMRKQVDKNKQTSIYKNAIRQLQAVSNYIPKSMLDAASSLADNATNLYDKGKKMVDSVIPSTPTAIMTNTPEEEGPVGKLINGFLSTVWEPIKNKLKDWGLSLAYDRQTYLISVGSADTVSAVKYANVLSTALNEYLQAENRICLDGDDIELECQVYGEKLKTHAAIQQFSEALTEEFLSPIYVSCFADLESNLPEITIDSNELYHRKFALRNAKNVKRA